MYNARVVKDGLWTVVYKPIVCKGIMKSPSEHVELTYFIPNMCFTVVHCQPWPIKANAQNISLSQQIPIEL